MEEVRGREGKVKRITFVPIGFTRCVKSGLRFKREHPEKVKKEEDYAKYVRFLHLSCSGSLKSHLDDTITS